MSKYDKLWIYIQNNGKGAFKLTFDEIRDIVGIPIDHSFLKYKKEAEGYGYRVGKIPQHISAIQITHRCVVLLTGRQPDFVVRLATHDLLLPLYIALFPWTAIKGVL